MASYPVHLRVSAFLVSLAIAATSGLFLHARAFSATPTPTAPTATATASAPTSTPPPIGSPLARITELVANINSGDLASVYAAVSPDVQQQFTLAELTEAIQNIEQGTGPIHIAILSVDSTSETGDQAEIDLTLRVQAGTSVDVTLRDITSLVRVNGAWRVADHFLQSAFTAIGLVRPGPLQRTFDAQGCAGGDVLAGVYAASRLHVIQPCVTATGAVHNVDHSLDGDISFNLALPPDKLYLLNDANLRDQSGMLEVEIVPGDQQRMQTPTEGELVTVTGPWVLDTVHGWNEIHPAWRVDQIQIGCSVAIIGRGGQRNPSLRSTNCGSLPLNGRGVAACQRSNDPRRSTVTSHYPLVLRSMHGSSVIWEVPGQRAKH
jgi:hypothetical protein